MLNTRVPRPFICSKYTRLRTSRRNTSTSSGLTSVPVAIMSTVTAMRSVGDRQNSLIRSSGFACLPAAVFDWYVIFLQKSLPFPNTSRQMWTMSSACESSFAKMSVFGTSVRPGKSSVNTASRYVRSTVRIWSGTTTERSRSVGV